MSAPEQAPSSLVYPPEWDVMTANEQMVWFLAHLSAQLDSIRAEFAAARAGDPAMAISQVDPAAASPTTATATLTTALAVLNADHGTTCRVAVAGTDEHPIVAASAEVASELAVLPGVFDSAINTQEVLVCPKGASLNYPAKLHMTCSMKCENQDNATLSFPLPITTVSLLPAAPTALVVGLVHPATNGDCTPQAPLAMMDVLLSSECSRYCLPDTPKLSRMIMVLPQAWQKRLMLRPTSWPSFWMGLADGYELMTPCICQKIICRIIMVPRDIIARSQLIIPFMDDLNLDTRECQLVVVCVQSSYEFHAQDVQPRFRFSQDNVHLKLSRPSAAICVSCTVLFGNQSMMLHDGYKMSYSLDARAMQCSGTITLDMLVKAEFIPSICTTLSSKGKGLGTTARVLLRCCPVSVSNRFVTIFECRSLV